MKKSPPPTNSLHDEAHNLMFEYGSNYGMIHENMIHSFLFVVRVARK